MKLTKARLKQIIKEEMNNLLNEAPPKELYKRRRERLERERAEKRKKAGKGVQKVGQIPVGTDGKALLTMGEIRRLQKSDPVNYVKEWNRYRGATAVNKKMWDEREKKLKKKLKEGREPITEGIDDMHEEAMKIASFWRKATKQLNMICKQPDMSPIDCNNVRQFFAVLQAHPVTKAASKGKLADEPYYGHYINYFAPNSPSIDPEVLKPIIDKVISNLKSYLSVLSKIKKESRKRRLRRKHRRG